MSFNLVTTETTYNDDGSPVIKDAITLSAFQNPLQILKGREIGAVTKSNSR